MTFITDRRFLFQSFGSIVASALAAPWAWAKAKPDLVLLAQDYTPGIDTSQYLVSEKYDGVRALWDGKILRFRSGRAIAAPEWFTAKLPATPLDGELWLARGEFDMLSGIVRRTKPMTDEWKRVNYMVFELPPALVKTNTTGNLPPQKAFSQRAERLREIVQAAGWSQLQVAEQFKISDEAQLKIKLADVVKNKGEGLMLHRADAPYTIGRSPVLLKLKPQLDEEALVTAHVPGRGKFEGMLGALQVETPEGTRFKLGTGFTDAQRKSPPPVGSTVTYTYRDKTPTGVPRFASFLRTLESV